MAFESPRLSPVCTRQHLNHLDRISALEGIEHSSGQGRPVLELLRGKGEVHAPNHQVSAPLDAELDRARKAEPVNEQLALFDEEEADLEIADLEGLLVAGAALVQRGAEARLSIVVREQWRASTIVEAYDRRGLPGEEVATFDGQVAVRTPFHRSLMPLVARWSRGSSKLPPPDWQLTPARVRLWVVATGRTDSSGYLLGLGRTDETACWTVAGTALAAVGLAGTLLGPRAGGPAFRIVGQRRTRRLCEMVGSRPAAAPPEAWPEPDLSEHH